MIHFECDYLEGADERVLKALCDTNLTQAVGYGEDELCDRARALIRELCAAPNAGVHFLVGGTQVNTTVIAAALRPYEGVLCADTGHINVHETGSIEATGHKCLPLPGTDGKITAAQVRQAVEKHRADGSFEHMVCPAMVYLSQPTELGTLYTAAELTEMYETTRALGILLYVDGARLGYGIAALPEVDMPFLAAHTDAFTIGGTKGGALFGEALVLADPAKWPGFRYHIKQRGGMLAKGRLLGVQFDALLRDGHYVAIAARADEQAQRIKRAFVQKGVRMLVDTPTNQIFPVLPDEWLQALKRDFSCSMWEKVDENHTAVRFCASVLTPEASVDALVDAIGRL
ncbi:MAG: beta-eliminating lyase-related protein [Eubacteriales bacterium]|nr:beta-eliminating lyase-related protein [Eubacteriales bacterium]